MMTPHNICFFIFPGVASYDVAGPVQALRATGLDRYNVVLGSVTGGLVESDCPGVAFGSVPTASVIDPIDTLIIPGGNAAPEAANDPVLVQWVGQLARRASRVACVCTGAFFAAEAGLLTGRRAATHWRFCDELEHRFRNIKVERDPIWIRDGGIWTSAGISAGVDLTLALIEEDSGHRGRTSGGAGVGRFLQAARRAITIQHLTLGPNCRRQRPTARFARLDRR